MSLGESTTRDRARRLSNQNLKLQHRKTAMMLTIPAHVKSTKFPTDEGVKLKPYLMEIDDPETSEEKEALVYIPE